MQASSHINNLMLVCSSYKINADDFLDSTNWPQKEPTIKELWSMNKDFNGKLQEIITEEKHRLKNEKLAQQISYMNKYDENLIEKILNAPIAQDAINYIKTYRMGSNKNLFGKGYDSDFDPLPYIGKYEDEIGLGFALKLKGATSIKSLNAYVESYKDQLKRYCPPPENKIKHVLVNYKGQVFKVKL
tara:strand:+ start:257 stop:817 length:561 start_codon:yes stop_codon:yes gene_type:complete